MEHIIEYIDDDGDWQRCTVEAVNWSNALERAPDEVKESEDWVVSVKSELVTKEEAVHSGIIDEILPE